MTYHPGEVAYTEANGNYLSLYDKEGVLIQSMNMTEQEIDSELDALESTRMFVPLGLPGVLVNLNHVSSVYGEEGALIFNNMDDKRIGARRMAEHEINKEIEALAQTPYFLIVPGNRGVVNYDAIEGIGYDGVNLEIPLRSGVIYSCLISARQAEPILNHVRAVLSVHAIAAMPLDDEPPAEAVPESEPAFITLTPEEEDNAKNLASELKKGILGQNKAVDVTVDAILRSLAGLQEDNKPIGSFIFKGPSGVGKTELARELARLLGVPFKKIDMSEFMEKFMVTRLIGPPNGYAHAEEGGELTNFVYENPRCVILFDEIEKAHPDVAKILLQVLDDARLTSGTKQIVNFNGTIIIMTTNLGADKNKKSVMGFGAKKEPRDGDPKNDPALKEYLLNEFIGRVTEVVEFDELSRSAMLGIVVKFISEISQKLAKRKIVMTTTAAAREQLAKRGLDPVFGARPLRNLIKKDVETPLSLQILFGDLKRGGQAHVDVDSIDSINCLTMTFNSTVADDFVAPAQGPAPVAPAVSESVKATSGASTTKTLHAEVSPS